MKRYFITGTDTDCGKTYVTCQLIKFLKQENQRILALKPIATGCMEQDGQLISDDASNLQRYNDHFSQDICPWRFQPPISPHLAAKAVGQRISANDITEFCHSMTSPALDYLLVEGAGGLMAPLNDEETWLDFLLVSQMPVILVVGMRLGCLNHALLTNLALKSQNIPCVGWIANCLDQDMLALSDNIETLSKKMSVPLLATIPCGGGIERHASYGKSMIANFI